MGSNPTQRLKDAPTLIAADKALDAYVDSAMRRLDANDVLYALEASRDYNPGPGLEKIKAPLIAVNFADDLINPPELRVLEREIKRVKRGEAVMIPESERTRGHGTHTMPAIWEKHLKRLLKKTEP
jgi:homoserine O-acetyltransferase